jgi:serine/threonine protein kinase
MLIVSTKRKVASAVGNGSHKDLINIPIFGGKSKKGKPAWRVDSPVPIKLAEMVLKEYDPTALGTLESQISQDLTLNAHPLLFSCNLPGPIYMKLEPGTYKKVYHRALYSRFTKCTLQELLNNENIFISTVQRRQIAFELLTAIKKMHELGYIHQDLHRGNILIHPDENGNYHIQLTDFGNSRPMYLVAKNQIEHLGDAKAPYTYESPEMLIAYRDGKFIPYREKRIGHHESYAKFCQPDVRSATEAQQRYYSHPHRANDIWAAGLIIFDLFNRHQSPEKYHDVIQNHTLFKRMLAVNREDRFTAQEALDTLRIYPDSFAIADDHPVQYWNPAPMQDVGQEPPINSESVVIPEIRKKAYTAVIEERTRTSGRFSFRSKN